jgi:GAF domain-containing protein/biotin carboxyl carrier protein
MKTNHQEQLDKSPGTTLFNLLRALCLLIKAEVGAVLRRNEREGVDVLVMHPQMEKDESVPEWLARAAALTEKAVSSNSVITEPAEERVHLQETDIKQYIFIAPIKLADISHAVAAFLVGIHNKAELETLRERVQLLSMLLNLSETRLSYLGKQKDLDRLRHAMETLAVINRQNRFKGAAMALCNEVASHWQCERTSIGFLKGRYVQLKAMSHAEDFNRKMKIVQDMESVMEECLDQDVEILSPAPEGSTYISRAADEYSKRYSSLTVLSLPLRNNEGVIAVLTLERPEGMAFSTEEIETLRLTCELCTARLADLYKYAQWIGATMEIKMREFMAGFLGPKHTWIKIAVLICSAALLFLIFGKGEFRPEAPFVLEATEQQVIPAPFEGYIKNVKVEINEMVEANSSVLAELDTAELRLQLAAAKSEMVGYLKQAAAAMRDRKIAEAQIAKANADKINAQIDLLNYNVSRASLVSPINGIVVKGDLKREIGAPVKTGDVLFEVCPIESLRAELMMPEDEIYYVAVGQEGYLATASYPSQRIKFVVERINPMAEVINQRNVFRVRVRLLETHNWMRPGMEGVSRVSVGKRHYIWIWTRKIINWIRLKLWL